jgi:hypothetical protein
MDIKYTKYVCYSCECYVADTPDIKAFITKKGVLHFCNNYCHKRKGESERLQAQIAKDIEVWEASGSSLPFDKWNSKRSWDMF